MGRRVSLRGFAREMGVTIRAVQKARDSERITVGADGKIDLVRGRKQWAENTIHTKRNRVGRRTKTVDHGASVRPSGGNGSQVASMGAGLLRAQTARMALQAKMLELEFRQKNGQLLEADEVRRQGFEVGRRIKDLLLAMPTRVGPDLVGVTDPGEMVRRLKMVVERMCDEIQAEISKNGGEP